MIKQLSRGNFNIINMLNAKYLVADQEITGGPLMTVVRDNQFVMRNTSALPRMWFVDRARVIADEPAHLRAVADPSWKPGRRRRCSSRSRGRLTPAEAAPRG